MKKWLKSHQIVLWVVVIIFSLFFGSIFGYAIHDFSGKLDTNTKYVSNTAATDNPIHIVTMSISDIDVYQLFTLTNEERSKAGLEQLVLNPKLSISALAKCNDMIAKNYWSHFDPEGNSPWHFITSAGIPYIHLGENLGSGYTNASAEITGWMISSEHKANILDPKFTDVGFGVCKSDSFVAEKGLPALVVVQHFARL